MAAGVVFAEAGRRGGDETLMRVFVNRHDEILGNIINTATKSQCNGLYHFESLES